MFFSLPLLAQTQAIVSKPYPIDQLGFSGQLYGGPKDVTYSLSIEKGKFAEVTAEELNHFPLVYAEKIHVDGYPVEIALREIPDTPERRQSFLKKVKKAFKEEYHSKTKEAVFLRHATFAISGAGSIFVWTAGMLAGTPELISPSSIEAINPAIEAINSFYQSIESSRLSLSQAFTGIALSLSINALFIYMEDNADYKLFRRPGMMGFARKVLNTYNGFRNKMMGSLQKVALGLKDAKESWSHWRNRMAFKAAYAFQNKSKPVGDMSTVSFISRVTSSGIVNLGIILLYETLKNGFPFDSAGLAEFSGSIALKWVAVMTISVGFSTSRATLKDLLKKGLVNERFVRFYAFAVKAGLTPFYLAMFLDMISNWDLMTYLGAPGWALAGGLLLYNSKLEKHHQKEAGAGVRPPSISELFDVNSFGYSARLDSRYGNILEVSDFSYLQEEVGSCRASLKK